MLAASLLQVSRLAVAADEVGMFLDLKVNQADRGEFAAYRSADGDFFIRLADFQQLGLKRDITLPRVRIAGEAGSFVSLRELGALSLLLDSAKMTLAVELPPEVFEKTTIDQATRDTRYTLASDQTSGFINYRLADTTYGTNTPTHSLSTELGLRYGGILLLNQSQNRDDGTSSRYLTQLVYDRPELQQRFIAGDYTATSSGLGSVLSMGGLNFSKLYTLTPDFIRQPMAGFTGVATSASQVEVRVDGVPVAYSQVGAGPFELQNLLRYGGANSVQVVVRDALGREQTYGFPFYYSEQSLREGLQEYSYSLGKIRSHLGQADDNYGPTAFSAFHRYGYSDTLTLGARAEAAQDLNNVGLEATWRNDYLGALAAAVSTSNFQGGLGDATMFTYNYRRPTFAFSTIARHYSSNYAPLETLVNGFHLNAEYGASLSWYPVPGHSFNFSHTRTETRTQGDNQITSLSYTHSLNSGNFLYGTLQRTDSDSAGLADTSLFIGWIYRFGGKYTASANATKDQNGQQTLFTQLARDIPRGEGLGYRVGWTGTQPKDIDRFSGYAQWNLPAASLSVDANTLPVQGSSADYRELAVAGSVAFAGNAWGFSRQISDSFAIVQMGAPVPGVSVLSNSQEIGVSSASGQVISPFVTSFYDSQISINEQDIPMQYAMQKNIYKVRPAYRGGIEVNFGLRRVQGLDGVLRMRVGANTPTADNRLVTLTQGGQLEQEFQVGREGHFYIENIAAGEYHGEIKTDDHACNFVLKVPATQEVVLTLPGDLVCE
jgi:outer membrane usher protein